MGDTNKRTRTEIAKRVRYEKRKMLKIFENSETIQADLGTITPIIENVCWMKVKLDDAREDIGEDGLIVPYDNGGGQRGVRENPAFKAYEALWKSYSGGMATILDLLPEATAKEAAASAASAASAPSAPNALALVLERRKNA